MGGVYRYLMTEKYFKEFIMIHILADRDMSYKLTAIRMSEHLNKVPRVAKGATIGLVLDRCILVIGLEVFRMGLENI